MSPSVHIEVFYQSPLKDLFVLYNAVDTFPVKQFGRYEGTLLLPHPTSLYLQQLCFITLLIIP